MDIGIGIYEAIRNGLKDPKWRVYMNRILFELTLTPSSGSPSSAPVEADETQELISSPPAEEYREEIDLNEI